MADLEMGRGMELMWLVIGWTIFDQVYLYNGTWFIVTDNPSSIPLLRLMTSTGREIFNDEESIRGR